MIITIFGIGYVGLANGIMLSQYNEVRMVDIDFSRVNQLNRRISPIEDKDISYYLTTKQLNIIATCDYKEALRNSNLVIVATPTNFDTNTNSFNTQSVLDVISSVSSNNPEIPIVIKSTVPVGFTASIAKTCKNEIVFSPEFLREGKALSDCLHPSRIIVGSRSINGSMIAKLFKESSEEQDVPTLLMNSTEAEAVKLFSNTYLAMRVSFFNELDTFAEEKNLDSKAIIEGVSLDERIGSHYNNPSFGYGGYCLPKDTKQLLSNFSGIPNKIIEATIHANLTRKIHIANQIIKKKPNIVGIFRLTMKKDSDNFRESAIIDIINILTTNNIHVLIFEPTFTGNEFMGCRVVSDMNELLISSDIILANRPSKELLESAKNKVYTRDIFSKD